MERIKAVNRKNNVKKIGNYKQLKNSFRENKPYKKQSKYIPGNGCNKTSITDVYNHPILADYRNNR